MNDMVQKFKNLASYMRMYTPGYKLDQLATLTHELAMKVKELEERIDRLEADIRKNFTDFDLFPA